MKNSTRILSWRRVLGLGAAVLLANVGLSSSASAQLTIVRANVGGAPPANLAGGGDLDTLFNAAADWWERTLCAPALAHKSIVLKNDFVLWEIKEEGNLWRSVRLARADGSVEDVLDAAILCEKDAVVFYESMKALVPAPAGRSGP